jgi:hypothetical protein
MVSYSCAVIHAFGATTGLPIQKAAILTRLSLSQQRQLFLRQFESFYCVFDGKRIPIPKHLWKTCFNPNLDRVNFRIRLYGAHRKFRIGMAGSDGAGGYLVIWTYSHHRWSRNKPYFSENFDVMDKIFGKDDPFQFNDHSGPKR